MINRRRFIQSLALAAATPATIARGQDTSSAFGFGPLINDPAGVIDLPEGFSYTIISRIGEAMDDGLIVPGYHDGMAAFPAPDGTIRIVCNHEIYAFSQQVGPYGNKAQNLSLISRDKIYDYGNGVTPGTGGTTTIHYDPKTRKRLGIRLSLAGTEINCAGGKTPWGTWLSCEETFLGPGTGFERGRVVHRDKPHGYVFEVPGDGSMADPVPLKAMGRFEHEAAAVDPRSGIVYLSEDRHRSLWYRFIPNVPGKLREGGRLQALAVRGEHNFDSRNWGQVTIAPGDVLETAWVDLEEPDVPVNDLRFRGHEKGAAMFARGEGLCFTEDECILTCTIGGPHRLGQVFAYRPGTAEGTPDESPGQLRIIAESDADSILMNADNVTMSPWGDLMVCEDTAGHCGVVGLRPDGSQYAFADNTHHRSELAGVCFSPDGETMFVNIQQRGLTLAINGPWKSVA